MQESVATKPEAAEEAPAQSPEDIKKGLIQDILAKAEILGVPTPDGLADRLSLLSVEGLQAILFPLVAKAQEKEAEEVRGILGEILPAKPAVEVKATTIRRSGDGFVITNGATTTSMTTPIAKAWAEVNDFLLPDGEEEILVQKKPAPEPAPVENFLAQSDAEVVLD